MRRIFVTLVCAAALAACGAASTATSAPGNGSGGSTSPTIATGNSSLGAVLVDSHGLTLYYFLPEKNAAIGACNAGCLATWPPVVVTGSPTATSGVTGTLGTVSITLNGAQVNEVTYNSWPLHTYSGDSAAGQTSGQGRDNVWYAGMPATTSSETGATGGSPATPTATATPSSTSSGGYGY